MTRPTDDRLDLRIRDRALDVAHRYAPWHPDLDWWVVGAQAAALLGAALVLLLIQGSDAFVVFLLGIGLCFVSAAWAWSAMQSVLPQVVLGWRGLRGGVGFATGIFVVFDFLGVAVSADGVGLLAVGLLLAGILGCVEWWVGRQPMGWRWPSLGGSIVSIAYGIVVLASGPSDRPLFIQTLALVALVVGAILGGRTVQLWRRTRPIAAGAADQPERAEDAVERTRVTAPPPGTSLAPTVTGRPTARKGRPTTRGTATPTPPAGRSTPPTDGPSAPRN